MAEKTKNSLGDREFDFDGFLELIKGKKLDVKYKKDNYKKDDVLSFPYLNFSVGEILFVFRPNMGGFQVGFDDKFHDFHGPAIEVIEPQKEGMKPHNKFIPLNEERIGALENENKKLWKAFSAHIKDYKNHCENFREASLRRLKESPKPNGILFDPRVKKPEKKFKPPIKRF